MAENNRTDLTFITNEPGHTLLDRFKVLIKDAEFFDVLVGYFYSSGFKAVYPSLENTKKIRILIGISTSKQTFDMMGKAREPVQQVLSFSHAEAKEEYGDLVVQELDNTENESDTDESIRKFIEWIRAGKLEIRAYPSQDIHSKVYIITFQESDRDTGRVITGSSNFTRAGLVDNLEFNVELKNRGDYDYARKKFEELWADSVDVSQKYIETIETRSWLNPNISPYELYLKFLYEYFRDELSRPDDIFMKYLPQNFKKLEYQEQAVLNTKKILLEYGGVFIADVVGLGKTYVGTMLAGQLDGRTLVLAPPVLLDKDNPGSWPNAFSDFRIHADFESIGKLDSVAERDLGKYSNIIIDEAHRFRNEMTVSYETLAEICRGKRVVLVTATPYNNTPEDILSLLKLFQNSRKSTIPNLPNLDSFFKGLSARLKKLDRKKDYQLYIETVRENSKEMREKVLKYLMVRRTRTEIEKYFFRDLKQQGLKFPEVEKPEPFFYELNKEEDAIFTRTIDLIANQMKYSRYTPLIYYKGKLEQNEVQAQRNLGRFMKILLVKRLESSFFAFQNSIDRFLRSYEMFIRELKKGNVYVSKKYANKLFDMLEGDNDDAIQKFIDEGKAEVFKAADFTESLKKDLESDLLVLKDIKEMWTKVKRDPKLLKFKKELAGNRILKESHLIIFTESKETAEYLYSSIEKTIPGKVLLFTGDSGEAVRDKVIENFDARARNRKDEYRILISTEVLSEGVNLHRSNVVINYDIPWNPTRMMQRVGRINRVDTTFDKIYTFNFFPSDQGNDEIKLREAAEAKINAFLTLLGGDAELLTEGEPVGSHELFDRLMSRKTLEGPEEEQETELKYLRQIQDIREKDPALFEKVKRLPKKARSAKIAEEKKEALITYFRRGKLQKFFMAGEGGAEELDFMSAADILESSPETERAKLSGRIYELLDENKDAFITATTEEYVETMGSKQGRDNIYEVIKILRVTLKNKSQFTEQQEAYLLSVHDRLEAGSLPKQTVKETLEALQALKTEMRNPLKVFAVVQQKISTKLLDAHYSEGSASTASKREVILSLLLSGDREGG